MATLDGPSARHVHAGGSVGSARAARGDRGRHLGRLCCDEGRRSSACARGKGGGKFRSSRRPVRLVLRRRVSVAATADDRGHPFIVDRMPQPPGPGGRPRGAPESQRRPILLAVSDDGRSLRRRAAREDARHPGLPGPHGHRPATTVVPTLRPTRRGPGVELVRSLHPILLRRKRWPWPLEWWEMRAPA